MIKDMLFKLARASSAPGEESKIAPLAVDLLSDYMSVTVDDLGNVIGKKQGQGTSFLLDAHLDSIGMIVTAVEKNGFLKVDKCGGIDIRTVSAHDVIVHGKEDLYGVVTSTPPHLATGDSKNASGFDQLMIDTGIDGDKIFSLVSPGDRVTLKSQYINLNGNIVSGAYFDNKAGVCAIIRCLEILKENSNSSPITVMLSAQEETGLKGAMCAGYSCEAEKCICVDVSFAKTGTTPKNITAELGKGAMIGFAPVLDYEMSRELEKLATDKNIPYQLEVMAGGTGTNSDVLAVSAGGKKTALISIPLKNMHTGVEILCIDDIESVAQLMAEYIIKCGGAHND